MRADPRRHRLHLVTGIVTSVALVFGPFLTMGRVEAATPVNGGGSGFAGLEIQQWQADTARKPYNLAINYSNQSSGVGRTNFANGLYDYGVSDIVYPGSEQALLNQLQAGRCGGKAGVECFRYVPVSSGGLSFMYNKVVGGSRLSNLRLTRDQVCGIFTHAPGYQKWGDLASTNSALSGDQSPINVITRADLAGESYVLSEYCIATAPTIWGPFINFEQNPGDPNEVRPDLANGQPTSSWPVRLEGGAVSPQRPGADGVANAVADPIEGTNAITYDAAGYALVRSFPVASVANAVNQFQQPDEANVTVALGYATGRGDGTFNLNFNGPDARAYFPSTYSYALAQVAGADPGKGATLGQFLCYAVGKGQVIAPQLRYARLSSAIVAISVAAITAIPGAPSAADCTAGSPAPPPPPSVAGGAAAQANGGAGAGAGAGGPGGAAAAGLAGAGAGGTTTTTISPEQAAAEAAAAAARKAAASASASGTKTGGITNADAIWYLLLGAIVCAIGVGVTNAKKASA